jgi:DNA-binding CsgD family transcriptional regulator
MPDEAIRQVTDQANNKVATSLFTLVALLVGVDLMADAGSGAGGLHLSAESTATLLALAGAAWFMRQIVAERSEAAAWRAQAEELLAGLGQTVEEQFTQWGLSPAEREVSLLLLKGLSFNEVAQVRNTSARTSREQARAVYKKSGVAGRAELSAWFIEDLLPPVES